MSYIGQRPVVGRYIKLDQISSGFNGSNTGFSMTAGSQAVFPGTARNLLLSLGGVIQEPDTDFTISGSTLTFTTPPVANTTFFGVIYGDMQATGTPSDGTVLPASIASSGNFSFPEVTVTGDVNIADSIIHSGDTDTKIRFGAANEFSVETGGVERLELTGTETVFNDTGVDTDFRIEGDTNANLFKVDAGNDRVGIGTSSPQQVFHVYHAADNGLARFESGDANCRIDLVDNSGQSSIEAIGNQLRFGTSSSNTERMRISSTGNVGIGTTSPNAKFVISDSSTFTAYGGSVPSIGDCMQSLSNVPASEAINNHATFQFGVNGGSHNRVNSISAVAESASNRKLAFAFCTDSGSNRNERMRISADGNVGIGTASPATLLHIRASSAPKLRIDDSDTSGVFTLEQDGANGSVLLSSAGTLSIGVTNDNAASTLTFLTRNNERLRIASDGKVGIGTTSPDFNCEIEGTGGGTGVSLGITNTGSDPAGINLKSGHGNWSIYNSHSVGDALEFRDESASTVPMIIDSSGQVGIGTTSPADPLHVKGSGTMATFEGTGGSAFIGIKDSDDGTIAFMGVDGGKLKFQTSGSSYSDKLVIDTSGNVMIGLSSTSNKFHVEGTTTGSRFGVDTSTNGIPAIAATNENNADIELVIYDGRSAIGSSVNIPLAFHTNGKTNERMRLTTSGELLVGMSNSQAVAGGSAKIQVQSNDSTGRISIVQHRNEAEGAPFLSLAKTRATSTNNSTLVQDGDTLGTIAFAGGDGTDIQTPAAQIVCQVDNTPGSNDMPGRLLFKTTQDGASATTERYRITHSGNLGWRNTAIYQRKTFFFVGQSGGTSLDTKISGNFENNDMLRVQYAFNWNAGDGGAWGTAIIWKQYEGTVRVRQLGEELASPADSVSFPHSGNDIWLRFTLTANSGMNGYAYISVEAGGCEPFPF